jgi:uncharacterized protein
MIAEAPCQSSSFVQAGEQDSVKERYSTETFYLDTCDVGFGVFANRAIAPGETILRFGGPIIDFAETKRRGPKECMAVQIGPNRYYDTQPPGVFVNHSCDPNAGIRDDQRLVALRAIGRGEEIRFDYSTTMEEQSFTMRCLCGEPECRGVVGDFSLLPEAVKARYLTQRVVMGFIRDRHLRAHTVDLAAGCVCAVAQ